MSGTNFLSKPWIIRQTLVWGILTAVISSAGFFYLDRAAALFFSRPDLELFYKFNREITNIGYSIHYFVLAIAAAIIARYFSRHISAFERSPNLRERVMNWSKFTIFCLICEGLIIELIKFIVGRKRPHLTPDFEHLDFSPFHLHWHWHSLPSGHSQVIFTVATILYLMKPKFGVWYFLTAAFLAFTRVVIQQHFFSDFCIGAYLGFTLTLWLNYFRKPGEILSKAQQ